MSQPKRTALRLAVDLASRPIEGEVQEPGGPVHPFVGWLGFFEALEQAVRDAAGDSTTEEDPDHAA
ncbi:hypothetical protein [Paraconexibacter sp.]|uniref:hypothetical protein n=1 Tax=Paraconexibacter sp. TaxID=2949640 RepID=UPI003565449D